jgi:hypothetical protein
MRREPGQRDGQTETTGKDRLAIFVTGIRDPTAAPRSSARSPHLPRRPGFGSGGVGAAGPPRPRAAGTDNGRAAPMPWGWPAGSVSMTFPKDDAAASGVTFFRRRV